MTDIHMEEKRNSEVAHNGCFFLSHKYAQNYGNVIYVKNDFGVCVLA